jgi:hypothetical protein
MAGFPLIPFAWFDSVSLRERLRMAPSIRLVADRITAPTDFADAFEREARRSEIAPEDGPVLVLQNVGSWAKRRGLGVNPTPMAGSWWGDLSGLEGRGLVALDDRLKINASEVYAGLRDGLALLDVRGWRLRAVHQDVHGWPWPRATNSTANTDLYTEGGLARLTGADLGRYIDRRTQFLDPVRAAVHRLSNGYIRDGVGRAVREVMGCPLLGYAANAPGASDYPTPNVYMYISEGQSAHDALWSAFMRLVRAFELGATPFPWVHDYEDARGLAWNRIVFMRWLGPLGLTKQWGLFKRAGVKTADLIQEFVEAAHVRRDLPSASAIAHDEAELFRAWVGDPEEIAEVFGTPTPERWKAAA